MAQGAQRRDISPDLGDIEGQAGQGSEHLSSCRCPCSWHRSWTRRSLRVPSNSNNSMIFIPVSAHYTHNEFLFSPISTCQEPDPVASEGLLSNKQPISIIAVRAGDISYYLPPCDLHESTPSWLSCTVLTLNRLIIIITP